MSSKPTIENISKATGFSPATISRVLNHPELVNDNTRIKVINAMRDLGYKQTQRSPSPDKGSSKGLIVIEVPWLDNPFYSEIIRGIQVSATAKGYDVSICWTHGSELDIRRFVNLCNYTQASGTIVLSPMEESTLLELESICPVVQCCEFNPAVASIPYVTIDDYSAARKAIEYLVACGCSKLSILRGPTTFKYARERYRAFMDVVEEKQLEFKKEWICKIPDNSYDLAYADACNLLAGPALPDAIFCCSDIFAAAAIAAAGKYQINVPNQLQVIGFDNIEISKMLVPALTTVSQPRYQMGFTAASLLLQRMKDVSTPDQISLEAQLIIRGSTLAK